MNNKKGINLIALTITIVILSIFATMIVLNVQNSVDNANKVAFAEELRNILDAVNVYWLENGNYPTSQSYTESEFIQLADTENRQALQEEIALNNETSAVFYKVNLNEIKSAEGLFNELGDEYNIYVINENATNIYYPMGFDIGNETYYSLSSKITDMDKVSINTSNSQVSLNTATSTIKVIKSTDEWTNNLTLTVDTSLNNEQLFYTIGNIETEITGALPYSMVLSSNTIATEQNDITFIKKTKRSNSCKN